MIYAVVQVSKPTHIVDIFEDQDVAVKFRKKLQAKNPDNDYTVSELDPTTVSY